MGKKSKIRIDDLLVSKGLASSIELARAMIMAGEVIVDDQRVDKPSKLLVEEASIRLREKGKYVSRGGDKLYGAIEDFGLAPEMKEAHVLDVGSSSGGFTDCCLSLGAKSVIALDVGRNQLVWKLRKDPRVTVLEQTDIRDFQPSDHDPINWVVADISFNSLARLVPDIRRAAPGGGVNFLVLVKPQFELRRDQVPDGGVVDDEGLRNEALKAVITAFDSVGLGGGKSVEAKIAGRTGNREIFYFVRSASGE